MQTGQFTVFPGLTIQELCIQYTVYAWPVTRILDSETTESSTEGASRLEGSGGMPSPRKFWIS